ncbi:MAG: preprotein translocase subunit SecE [Phycisphaerales bacterium]
MSSWGLYKPGQGYWVRVITAAVIGVIAFATAGWLMAQMNVLSTKFPVRSWVSELANVTGGVPAVGDRVTLVRVVDGGASPARVLGTAQITEYDASASVVNLGRFERAEPDARPEDATTIEAADGQGFKARVRNSVRGLPPVRAIYLQGGAAAVALLAGALVAFYFCGSKPQTSDFLISTDMEMKKVNWSTRKDITTSTIVVVAAAFLLSGVLLMIDIAFQWFFRGVGVLQ